MSYTPLERPASTQQERIDALKVAKPLVTTTSAARVDGADVLDILRVAEYITTGHDYLDTHPQEDEPEELESTPVVFNFHGDIDTERADEIAKEIRDRVFKAGIPNV